MKWTSFANRAGRLPFLAATALSFALTSTAFGGVAVSFSASAPATGANDQFNLLDDATIPNGNSPGGGSYNSQSYFDNAGPLGQTFKTPTGGAGYKVTAISVKAVGDGGGGVFDSPNTLALRISSVSGTALTPINTITNIPTLAGQATNVVGWLTFDLSGSDALALAPNTQYAFELYSSNGWFGVDATQGDAAYAGGTAFNSAGASRSFADNTLGNLANHGYDRTFHVALTANVPEPATGFMTICGLTGTGLLASRRRR